MTEAPGRTALTAAQAGDSSPAELIEALVLLCRMQDVLAGLEPELIAAARTAGVSRQALAPALGVASQQAAERRYLRSVSAPIGEPGATRDARVQAERDRHDRHCMNGPDQECPPACIYGQFQIRGMRFGTNGPAPGRTRQQRIRPLGATRSAYGQGLLSGWREYSVGVRPNCCLKARLK